MELASPAGYEERGLVAGHTSSLSAQIVGDVRRALLAGRLRPGDVLGTEDARYSGPGEGPQGTAAFRSGSGITGEIAIGDKGTDGNLWRQAN